ncbi:MAG: hypothetical protein IAE93_12835 [Ignavibacteria bacterium]|nr:hypothetical protein [Ignavibacteria bacterium]
MDFNTTQIIIGIIQIIIGIPSCIIAFKVLKKSLIKRQEKVIKTIIYLHKKWILGMMVILIICLGLVGMITSNNEIMFIYSLLASAFNIYNVFTIYNYGGKFKKLREIKKDMNDVNKALEEVEEEYKNIKTTSYIK